MRTYSSPAEFLNEDNLPESGCLIVNYQMPGMNRTATGSAAARSAILDADYTRYRYSNDNLRKRAAIAGVSIVEKPFLKHRLVDCVRRAFDGQNA